LFGPTLVFIGKTYTKEKAKGWVVERTNYSLKERERERERKQTTFVGICKQDFFTKRLLKGATLEEGPRSIGSMNSRNLIGPKAFR
jgi:hypothetical protein